MEQWLDIALFSLVSAFGLAVARERSAAKAKEPEVPCEPSDWKYKAEGKHNVVMTYCGDDPAWDGIAIRLRKLHRGDSTEDVAENHGLFPVRMDDFSRQIMRPLVGESYVDLCQLVNLPSSAMKRLEGVLRRDDELRPVTRRHSTIDTDLATAILLTDSTSVHAPLSEVQRALGGTTMPVTRLGAPVAIEIKPKAGLVVSATDAGAPFAGDRGKDCTSCASEATYGLSDSDLHCEAGSSAQGVSKFRMQQIWKVTKGKALRASAYSPLQLFGTPAACQRALTALAHTPHNNFRVFARGSVPFPPNHVVDRIGKAERDAMARGSDRPGVRAPSPAEYASSLSKTLAATFLHSLTPEDGRVSASSSTRSTEEPSSWHGLGEADAAATAGFDPRSTSGLLVKILAHILHREPLLKQLQATQRLGQITTSERLWELYRPHLERVAGRAFPSASAAYKWAREAGTEVLQAKAVEALAGCGHPDSELREMQQFLVAQAACDCSLLVSMQLVRCADRCAVAQTQGDPDREGSEAATAEDVLEAARRDRGRSASASTPAPELRSDGIRGAATVSARAIGAVRLQDCCGDTVSVPSAVEVARLDRMKSKHEAGGRPRGAVEDTSAVASDVRDLWIVYRLSLVDLEPKLVARVPKYAAKDDDISAAYALFLSSPAGAAVPRPASA
jgi:hypothetical protein